MSSPICSHADRADSSVAYYWGVVGLLIGMTLYRPAYSATALKGTLLDNPKWITFWSGFILVSLTVFIVVPLTRRSPKHSTFTPTCTSPHCVNPPDSRVCIRLAGASESPSAQTTGMRSLAWSASSRSPAVISAVSLDVLRLDMPLMSAIIYTCIGTYFMTIWSIGKYKRYKREFDPKVFPGRRYKLFPPFF